MAIHFPQSHRSLLGAILCATVFVSGCGKGGPTKSEKAAVKAQRDQQLLTLPYPKAAGTLPKSIDSRYDSTSDRTTAVFTLTALRPPTASTSRLSSTTLVLTSSHKGRVRSPNDVEGSVDGAVVGTSATQGVLAYSGGPGTILADGVELPLKEASAGKGYSSAPITGGYEETVRFRVPTEHLVAAANAKVITLKFAGVEVELSDSQMIELRAFAATLNPRP